jgi:ATP phosphoribosyltransferase
MKTNRTLTMAMPKGSLQDYSLRVFREAGFDIQPLSRSYIVRTDDPELECVLLRPQEIPKYVENGKLDAGISGYDWILETRADVVEVCDLKYAKYQVNKVKWVLAVPEGSGIKKVKDLQGKIISTEIVNMTKDYLAKKGVSAQVEFSWGATEVKPPRFSDAVVDLTETGSSLQAHNLRILDVVLESSTKLMANKNAWQDPWKKEKIENLAILLKGAIESEQFANLMMHVPLEKLNKITKFLSSCELNPGARKLAGENWYDVSITCSNKKTRELIPQLKRLGCEAIIQFPTLKSVP